MDRTCAPDPMTYFQRNVMPVEVPTTWENKYDPQHPRADWAGLVPSEEYGRKHFESHASMRTGIKQAEEGIVSQVERQEWSQKRRDIKDPINYGITTPRSELQKYYDNESKENGTKNLIGGVSYDNDSDRFKTTYQALASKEKTDRSQMTLNKRQLPKKNNVINNINGSGPSSAQQTPRQYNPSSSGSYYIEDGPSFAGLDSVAAASKSLVGFRAPRTSLLAGLADSVVDAVPAQEPSTAALSYIYRRK